MIAAEPVDVETAMKAIEVIREKELTAFNSGDIQAFLDIVSDDAVIDPPGGPAAIGRDAIAALLEVVFKRFEYDATYSTDELVVEGDWAFDRGIWFERRRHKGDGSKTEVPCGILQIYRRQPDSSWKLARSIWNMKQRSS